MERGLRKFLAYFKGNFCYRIAVVAIAYPIRWAIQKDLAWLSAFEPLLALYTEISLPIG